ncbi:hypothetical protein EX30DRAFT_396636 [Ascodesmis nigricans]|uniref:Uncharacterized protein n=1 Tax=Ascodesmis nigricans TaxID=341454 RepID=A0A4S2MUA0_9PEZI|nr:hypothetical protein EX30DRAFT_396636 [Ascodesmis nigricans]
MPPRHPSLQERRLAPPSLLHHYHHSDSHDSHHPTNQDPDFPRRPVIQHSRKLFYRPVIKHSRPSGGRRGGQEVKGRPVILHLQSQRQSHHETDDEEDDYEEVGDDETEEEEEEQELLEEQQEEQKPERQKKGWYNGRPVIRHPGRGEGGIEASKTDEFRPWTSDLGPRSIPADTGDGSGSVLRKRSLDTTTPPPPPVSTSSSLTDSNLDLDSLLPTTTTPTLLDCPLDLQKALPKFKKYRPTNPADISRLARLANSGCGGRATTLWYQDLPVGSNGLPDGAAGSVVGVLFAVFALMGVASVVSIARIWLRERKRRGWEE